MIRFGKAGPFDIPVQEIGGSFALSGLALQFYSKSPWKASVIGEMSQVLHAKLDQPGC